MIYIFLCAIILMYLFILFKSRNVDGQFTSKKLYLFIILFLSVITVYIFSLSYDLSNTADYKQIHSKNMSVRNNIKTIRENIPKLESRLLNSSDDFNGWLMLGKSYSILENYQKASKAYQIAINLRPDNMDALREYILVLRSDGEIVNKDLIEKYFVIYIDKTNEPQALLDLLSFSFNVNDNLLAQNTLNEIIQHPNIANKNEYKKLNIQTSWGGHGASRNADAYFISKKCCEILVNEFNSGEIIDLPIDWWLNKIIEKFDLDVYWAQPTIVTTNLYETSFNAD